MNIKVFHILNGTKQALFVQFNCWWNYTKLFNPILQNNEKKIVWIIIEINELLWKLIFCKYFLLKRNETQELEWASKGKNQSGVFMFSGKICSLKKYEIIYFNIQNFFRTKFNFFPICSIFSLKFSNWRNRSANVIYKK